MTAYKLILMWAADSLRVEARKWKAFGDPARWRIFCALADGPRSVTDLCEELDTSRRSQRILPCCGGRDSSQPAAAATSTSTVSTRDHLICCLTGSWNCRGGRGRTRWRAGSTARAAATGHVGAARAMNGPAPRLSNCPLPLASGQLPLLVSSPPSEVG